MAHLITTTHGPNILDVNFLYPVYEIVLRSESDGNLRIMKQQGGISDLSIIKLLRFDELVKMVNHF